MPVPYKRPYSLNFSFLLQRHNPDMFRLDSDRFLKEFLMSLWKHHDLQLEQNYYCHMEKCHPQYSVHVGVYKACISLSAHSELCTHSQYKLLLRNYLQLEVVLHFGKGQKRSNPFTVEP